MRAIFYDTETTGVRPDKDAIIEIAAFDPITKENYVSFVNPGVPIPPDATAIHHITDEMVQSAPSFAKVAEELVAFCGEKAVLIAHNNDRFDKIFLQHEFKRHEVILPKHNMALF